jgi:hypothetical protein
MDAAPPVVAAMRQVKLSIAATMVAWTLGLTPVVVAIARNDARGLRLLYLLALLGAPALNIVGIVLAIRARRLGRDQVGCLAVLAIVLAALGLLGTLPLLMSAILFLPS